MNRVLLAGEGPVDGPRVVWRDIRDIERCETLRNEHRSPQKNQRQASIQWHHKDIGACMMSRLPAWKELWLAWNSHRQNSKLPLNLGLSILVDTLCGRKNRWHRDGLESSLGLIWHHLVRFLLEAKPAATSCESWWLVRELILIYYCVEFWIRMWKAMITLKYRYGLLSYWVTGTGQSHETRSLQTKHPGETITKEAMCAYIYMHAIELMANFLIRRHVGRPMTGLFGDTFWLQSFGARYPSRRHDCNLRQRPLVASRERWLCIQEQNQDRERKLSSFGFRSATIPQRWNTQANQHKASLSAHLIAPRVLSSC